MLECLANRQMQDTVAVTVRYFGGIKLGAGGLIRAYSKSVSNALDQAVITQKQKRLVYYMTFSYELIGKLDHYFRQNEVAVLDLVMIVGRIDAVTQRVYGYIEEEMDTEISILHEQRI